MSAQPPRAEVKALFAAYTEATGFKLTFNFPKERVCLDLHRLGATPENVRAMIGEIRRRLAKGLRGYTDASLEWRNAMDPVNFEQRLAALKLIEERRAAKAAKAGTKARETAQETPATLSDDDALAMRKAALAKMKAAISGGQPS